MAFRSLVGWAAKGRKDAVRRQARVTDFRWLPEGGRVEEGVRGKGKGEGW